MNHDHHTQARLYALGGYARRADRLDGRSPNLSYRFAWCLALAVAVIYVVTK